MSLIIIGSGPAGISAAIYVVRAGIDVTVISNGFGALEKAEKIQNYYGLVMSGKELHETGISQAKSLGVKFINDEVLGIGFEDKLKVQTKNQNLSADAVLIATGTKRKTPNIEGISKFEGKGLSYCAVCDAFFHRGKDVAVIGNSEYALHEALELVQTSASVSILTNGDELLCPVPQNIKVIKTKIEKLEGDNVLEKVCFKNGEEIAFSGVFVALGSAGATDLAKKLGAICEDNKIAVNDDMSTNITGLYAAGDCTKGMLQVAKAVYEGALAANSIIKFLRK